MQPAPYPGDDVTPVRGGPAPLRREYRDALGRPMTGRVIVTPYTGAVVEIPLVDGVLEADLPPGSYTLVAELTSPDQRTSYQTEVVNR